MEVPAVFTGRCWNQKSRQKHYRIFGQVKSLPRITVMATPIVGICMTDKLMLQFTSQGTHYCNCDEEIIQARSTEDYQSRPESCCQRNQTQTKQRDIDHQQRLSSGLWIYIIRCWPTFNDFKGWSPHDCNMGFVDGIDFRWKLARDAWRRYAYILSPTRPLLKEIPPASDQSTQPVGFLVKAQRHASAQTSYERMKWLCWLFLHTAFCGRTDADSSTFMHENPKFGLPQCL